MLMAVNDFLPDAPRLHVNGDTKVVTVNNISKGMVRNLGGGTFLWSSSEGEGRVLSETEAFRMIGFKLFKDRQGDPCIQALLGGIAVKLAGDTLPGVLIDDE